MPSLLQNRGQDTDYEDDDADVEDDDADVERFDNDDVDIPNIEKQLEVFRQQWKEEIRDNTPNQDADDQIMDNEKEVKRKMSNEVVC